MSNENSLLDIVSAVLLKNQIKDMVDSFDTYRGTSVKRFLTIAKSMGFVVEGQYSIEGMDFIEGKKTIIYYPVYLLYHALKGQVLTIETQTVKSKEAELSVDLIVSRASLHFQWRPLYRYLDEVPYMPAFEYSGGWDDAYGPRPTFVGLMDVTTAFRKKWNVLNENGRFLTTWHWCPSIYPSQSSLILGDCKHYTSASKNGASFGHLSEELKTLIGLEL